MFDKLIRQLQQLDGLELSVPLKPEVDGDGYVEKECPSKDCLFLFKVHADDWRDIVRDEEVFCPACGHSAPSKSWWSTQQIEWAKEHAMAQVKDMVGEAMAVDAREWNRRQPRNAFISITMNVESQPQQVVLPLSASEPMRLKIQCSACQCRHSVIGSAYFCPSCGHNAADRLFEQSLKKILAALESIGPIRAGLSDPDTAANTVQLIIENGLQNAVTAFQKFAEALWINQPGTERPRRNVLQNLAEGSNLWATRGKSYETILSAHELASLGRYFQQRHLLAHAEGLVDEDYVRRSGNNSYRVGQRLVVREAHVRECVALVEKLGKGLL